MTDEELKAIEQRAEDAAPGPWRSGDYFSIVDAKGDDVCATTRDELTEEFIAHARADVPALVAEVRRLRALVTCDCGRDKGGGTCPVCDRDE